MIGRITYWNNVKGYGFITLAKTELTGTFQQQYFFHHSNFKDGETAVLGGIVAFQIGEPIAEGKRLQAVGVHYAAPAEVRQSQQQKLTSGIALVGFDALKAGL